MADKPCDVQDWMCWSGAGDAISETAQQVGNDFLGRTTEETFTAFGNFASQLAFSWVYAPSVPLSGGGVVENSAPLPAGVVALLGQAKWVGFAFAILALLILAGRMVV